MDEIIRKRLQVELADIERSAYDNLPQEAKDALAKWNAGNLSTEDLYKIMGVKEGDYKLAYKLEGGV